MKIEQLIEAMNEVFNDMSQKATSIAKNAAANTASADRMAKIDLLKQQQAQRNAAGIKRPPAALAKTAAAPAATAPAATTPAAVPPGQAEPATTTPAATTQAAPAAQPQVDANGQPVKNSFIGKAVGALANVAGNAVGGARRGYNAQMGTANTSYTPRGNAGGGGAGAAGGDTANSIQALTARIDNLEKRLATTAESFKFESKFLGMKI